MIVVTMNYDLYNQSVQYAHSKKKYVKFKICLNLTFNIIAWIKKKPLCDQFIN